MRTVTIVLGVCAGAVCGSFASTPITEGSAAWSVSRAAPSAAGAAGSASVAAPFGSGFAATSASVAAPPGSGFAATSASVPAPFAASASCRRPAGPLYGVVRATGGRIFARIGRRSLRARSSPQVPLPAGVYGVSWAFSPTCNAVALGGDRGQVLLVDLERGRRIGRLALGTGSIVSELAWPRSDRLMALAGPFEAPRAVTVSVPGGRVVGSRPIGGRPWVSEATSDGIVVLAAPGDRIGTATLVLANPDGGLLRAPLPRIRAGFDEVGPLRMARQITPGLAVDATGGRAFVVAANEPLVAEVDLASGTPTYHRLRGGGVAASGPVASKGLAYGAFRTARWIGDGTIAVSGELTRTRPDRRRGARRLRTVTRTDPYGLRLIRTADWTATTLNPLLKSFMVAGDLLLGMNGEPAALSRAHPTGLVVYRLDGRRRFTRFRGSGRAWLRDVAWPYAYVREISPRRTLVVDLRNGRTVGETGSRRPPVLLTP
jgi:hypothetical protein